MLSREQVRRAVAETWRKTSNSGSENWFDLLADAIMDLLPDAEALGRAAQRCVSNAVSPVSDWYLRDEHEHFADIGNAILDALRKEREG